VGKRNFLLLALVSSLTLILVYFQFSSSASSLDIPMRLQYEEAIIDVPVEKVYKPTKEPSFTQQPANILDTTEYELTCPGFTQAKFKHIDSMHKLIIEQATLWLLEGEDRDFIAETLAANLGFKLAMQWLEQVHPISRFYDKSDLLKNTLLNLESNDIVENPIRRGDFSRYQWRLNSQERKGKELIEFAQDEVAKYPDISDAIWLAVVDNAIYSQDIEALELAIKEFDLDVNSPLWSSFLMGKVLKQLSFSVPDNYNLQGVLDHLSLMGPYYIDSNTPKAFGSKAVLDGLEARGYSFENWHIVDNANLSFNTYPSITSKFEALTETQANKFKPLEAKLWCQESGREEAYHKNISLKSLSLAQDSLAEDWQGVLNMCKASLMDRALEKSVLLKELLNDHGWSMEELSNLDRLKKTDLAPLKQSLENASLDLMPLLFMAKGHEASREKAKTFDTLSLLMEKGLYPNSPDLLFAFRYFSLEKSQALLEKVLNLQPFTSYGVSLIFNSIGIGKNELALSLINQGYPLKRDVASPDPLHLALEMQMGEYGSAEEQEIASQLLAALVANTEEITEAHINSMYQLKLYKPEMFEELVEQYPQLYPYEPEYLVEFKCF